MRMGPVARALQIAECKGGSQSSDGRRSPVLGRRGSRFHATSCCVLLGSVDGLGFNGKVAQTLVPEPLDSTTKSPQMAGALAHSCDSHSRAVGLNFSESFRGHSIALVFNLYVDPVPFALKSNNGLRSLFSRVCMPTERTVLTLIVGADP
jgi:hypothetical protein